MLLLGWGGALVMITTVVYTAFTSPATYYLPRCSSCLLWLWLVIVNCGSYDASEGFFHFTISIINRNVIVKLA